MNFPVCIGAATTTALFGNPWLALLAILAGIAIFMAMVAATGHWLAATHPAIEPAVRSRPTSANATAALAANSLPTSETLAIIAAAVRVTLGANARIAQIVPVKPLVPSVEMLMQQWSMEGRRQIYSSHGIR